MIQPNVTSVVLPRSLRVVAFPAFGENGAFHAPYFCTSSAVIRPLCESVSTNWSRRTVITAISSSVD